MQRELVFRKDKRGGRRAGAGRKPTGRRRDPRHRRRPEISRHHPQHVTLRVVENVGRLRRMDMYQAVHRALQSQLARTDFRCVHVSIQGNHLHLICEAENRAALRAAIQGLKISLAHWFKVVLVKRGRPCSGRIFAYRYATTSITTPKQCRNTLAYVLNNWRRHNEDRLSDALVDRFSSAVHFDGWKDIVSFAIPDGYDPLPVVSPTTWLLRAGWRRHGPIPTHFVPGPRSIAP
jgi:hypothetical protein